MAWSPFLPSPPPPRFIWSRLTIRYFCVHGPGHQARFPIGAIIVAGLAAWYALSFPNRRFELSHMQKLAPRTTMEVRVRA